MGDRSEGFEKLWAIINQDVDHCLSGTHEFPLTAMTRAVAEAVWRLPVPPQPDNTTRCALDVGTGTGVHALFMLARGYEVHAFDVSKDAIRHARARAERLGPAIGRLPDVNLGPGRQPSRVRFSISGVDAFKESHRYGLITFNPPAYYNMRGFVEATPAARGVFVDDNDHRRHEASLLYRFFEHIVLRFLAPEGHAICSWPGLERRVVEATVGETPGRVISPLEKLETWFPVTVIGDRNPHQFFNRSASVDSDQGLHDTFWENLIEARRRFMYSELADTSQAERQMLTFKFGVLHLTRDATDPTLFRHVPEVS